MGFGLATTAIKTYGIWSTFMAHLVETSFRKSVEEYSQLEEAQNCLQKRVTELQADLQKLETYKSMQKGKSAKQA